jgi:hypothetical protein
LCEYLSASWETSKLSDFLNVRLCSFAFRKSLKKGGDEENHERVQQPEENTKRDFQFNTLNGKHLVAFE